MTGLELLTLIQAIQAAIAAGPSLYSTAATAVAFVDSLFSAGVITKAQQDEIRKAVDATAAAVLTGGEPPHWTVEPDPAV